MIHEFLSREFMFYYESLLCTWYLVHCTTRIPTLFFVLCTLYNNLYQVASIKTLFVEIQDSFVLRISTSSFFIRRSSFDITRRGGQVSSIKYQDARNCAKYYGL